MRGWLFIPLMIMAFSGCLTDDADDSGETPPVEGKPWDCQPTDFEDPGIQIQNTTDDPIVDERELQWDFNTTNVRSCSLRAIGHTPLRFNETGVPDPHGYIGEIDMRGDLDLGAVAVLGAGGETPTVYLLDISNRTMPVVLSTIELTGHYLVDVKIGDAGERLYVASQALPAIPDPNNPLQSETYGVTGAAPSGPTGFTVYDITNPSAPEYVINIPDTQLGCHMLNHQIVGTTHVVACVSQQVRLHAFDTTGGQFAYIGFVDYVPEGDDAPLPSGVPAVGDPTGTLSSGPHDMILQRDPVTDDLLMIVSHWDSGMRIVDLNNAPAGEEVGKWMGEGATHYAGNVHTAMMFYADGTRYIMASPEYTSGGTVPSLWLLDATDLSAPTLVAEWFHPNEHDSQGLYLTTHQWQVAPTGPDVNISDVKVYLTMNHGGVWVIGLEEMLEGDMWGAIKGYHLGRTPLDPNKVITGNAVLSTWDVNLVDGYIYGSDRATGLWIFEHEDDELGDESLTGFN